MYDQQNQEAMPSRPSRSVATRDMTSLDDITHDFNDCAKYREYCLAKYGQYFTHDGYRITK
jgi:hypothetical protein